LERLLGAVVKRLQGSQEAPTEQEYMQALPIGDCVLIPALELTREYAGHVLILLLTSGLYAGLNADTVAPAARIL
jgi:hypothetical protein